MRLTTFTDYSLRVLIYVALKGDEKATISEIAQSYDISRNHLTKVVQDLSQKQYLTSTRGKNGGLHLKRLPETINIGRLVREMENDLALIECLGSENNCRITPLCGFRGVFEEALKAFFDTLENYTLADLLPESNQQGLAELLHIS